MVDFEAIEKFERLFTEMHATLLDIARSTRDENTALHYAADMTAHGMMLVSELACGFTLPPQDAYRLVSEAGRA